MRGRPFRLPREDEGLFRDLWTNPEIRLPAIMATFRMSEATTLTTARRLGLELRSAYRVRAGLSSHGKLAAKRAKAIPAVRAPIPAIYRRCAVCCGVEVVAHPHAHDAEAA